LLPSWPCGMDRHQSILDALHTQMHRFPCIE
jgi:hypothetical protein